MTHSQTDDSARATDTYLLFAHEAYYPDAGTQEINTTVVAAAWGPPRSSAMDRTRYENRANPPTGGWSPIRASP
jgi:proline dehydrogenase